MNKAQKEVQQAQIDDEKKVIKLLEAVYDRARKDCEQKIKELSARTDLENLQSIIYQKDYQQAMVDQLEAILYDLREGQFTTIADYLQNSYINGYVGVYYDLQTSHIPALVIPINQDQVVRAVKTNSKISSGLYKRLGEDVDYLKRSIRAELSRGIANGSTWNEMAAKIAKGMNSPFDRAYNNAIRIARTEGHRIQNEAALDGQRGAKSKGADIVKQWDSTLDGRTRPEHREADGQIREIDEPFEVGGEKMQASGVGGSARNVCNCRCCLLQRAKWALDDDELKSLEERAAFFGLDKSRDFEDFRQKYLKLPEKADTIEVKEYDVLAHTQKLKGAMSSSDYDEYMKILTEHSNTSLQKLYAKYADKISGIKKGKSGHYTPATGELVFSYPIQKHIDNGMSKYRTLAHEYGHFFDEKADYEGLHFAEIETIHSKTKYQINRFEKIASSSDEFLTAVRKDRQFLKSTLTTDVEKDLKDHDTSCGVQDAIDGLLAHRIWWGHGDKYYNRKYSSVKKLNEHRGLQAAYKELGIDASNLGKVAKECRIYESASEMWANIMGAEVNGGSELEYVKKYLPNSYKAFIEILKGVK